MALRWQGLGVPAWAGRLRDPLNLYREPDGHPPGARESRRRVYEKTPIQFFLKIPEWQHSFSFLVLEAMRMFGGCCRMGLGMSDYFRKSTLRTGEVMRVGEGNDHWWVPKPCGYSCGVYGWMSRIVVWTGSFEGSSLRILVWKYLHN